MAENELAVWLGQLLRHGRPDRGELGELAGRGMLGKVQLVACEDILLDGLDLFQIPRFTPDRDCHQFRNRRTRLEAGQIVRQSLIPRCRKELIEGHGVQRADIHLAHREGLVLVDGKAEQGAGAGHMILRRVLAEILQRRDRARALLDLVQNDQRVAGCDRSAKEQPQLEQDPLHVIVLLEQRAQGSGFFKVEISDVLIILPPEFFEDISLPALAHALQYQRLAVRLFLPGEQLLHDIPFHMTHHPSHSQCHVKLS